jgi:L-alanine-DL-glutamate epimerase-like enolase superfamily enzyme
MKDAMKHKRISLAQAEIFLLKAEVSKPVRTSFGAMNDRPCILVKLEDEDGVCGWGEVWCNFPNGGAEHRANLLSEILIPMLRNQNKIDPIELSPYLNQKTHILKIQCGEPGPISQAIAGLDIAAWDLAARKRGVPLYKMISKKAAQKIPVYASGINPESSLETVLTSRSASYNAFKLKIGFGFDSDLENIFRIARQLRSIESLMLDANQAWRLSEAKAFVKELTDIQIEWLEEPLPADRPSEEWAELSDASPFPLAAGENIIGNNGFAEAISAGNIGVVQPDVCKWGGVTGCLMVAKKAMAAGKRYCPHYLGGGIGLMASAHVLAAAGGDGLLEVDINQNPLRENLVKPFPKIADGMLTMPAAPGLGVAPDFAIIEKYLARRMQIRI